MESILVINAGSTSIKYKLYTYSRLEEMQANVAPLERGADIARAFKSILRSVGDISDIKAIGHRIVHGGSEFHQPMLMDAGTLRRLEPVSELAPLHNPHNLGAIKASLEYLPHVPNVAVFDTAWFADMPAHNRWYPLPLPLQERLKIRRYGFHGISHQYAAEQASLSLRMSLKKINLITVHLGGGCSAAAVQKGVAIDTSMGFTPLEGLMMQSRAGTIDPGVVMFLADQGVDIKILFQSGAGISGVSGCKDYLELLSHLKAKRPEAILAYSMFIDRIRKQIAAFMTELQKVDAIVFTGMIGAGDERTRNDAVKNMGEIIGGARMIVVPPNEEQIIARETKRLVAQSGLAIS